MEKITSLKNQKVSVWRSLKDKKGRKAAGLFLVEGPKMVKESLDSSFPVQAFILREGYVPPFHLPETIASFCLPEQVFQSVCDTKTPQGIAAVIHTHFLPLKGSRLLALDGIQDPGNLGTIVRTADAAGFEGILLSPDCADLFSPKVLRSTMGSIFRMTFAFPESLSLLLRDYRCRGFSVLSSQLDGDPFYSRQNVSSSLILVIGNEGNGVSDPVRAEATHHLRLPMLGGAESLNAAVAAGIMMYDLSFSS